MMRGTVAERRPDTPPQPGSAESATAQLTDGRRDGIGDVSTDGAEADEVTVTAHTYVMVTFLVMFDFFAISNMGVLGALLPILASSLSTTDATVAWVLFGPQILMTMFSPAAGKLADLKGRRLCWAIGAVVEISSLICSACSQDIETLIVARAFFGIGMAFQFPSAQAIVQAAFPKRRRGTVIGVYTGVMVFGPSLGVVVGGLLYDNYGSWQMLFWAPAPFMCCLFFLAMCTAREPPRPPDAPLVVAAADDTEAGKGDGGTTKSQDTTLAPSKPAKKKLDVVGTLLLSCTTFCLVFAINQGSSLGWKAPAIVGMFVAFSLLFPCLISHQIRNKEIAVLPPEFFANPTILLVSLVMFTHRMAYAGTFMLMPFFLNQVLGMSLSQAALIIGVRPFVGVFMSPIVGWLTLYVSCTKLIFLGCCCGVFVYFAYMYAFSASSSVTLVIVVLIFQGVTMFMMNGPSVTLIVNNVPKRIFGNVNGVNSMLQTMATVIGMAIFLACVDGNGGTAVPNGYMSAAAMALTLVCLVLIPMLILLWWDCKDKAGMRDWMVGGSGARVGSFNVGDVKVEGFFPLAAVSDEELEEDREAAAKAKMYSWSEMQEMVDVALQQQQRDQEQQKHAGSSERLVDFEWRSEADDKHRPRIGH